MPRGSPAKSAPPRTPRLGKRARTRRALLEAAVRVLARGGSGPVSIQDVTAEAGLANGTFYNYFRTREELLEAMVGPLTQRLVERLRAASSAAGMSDPAWRLAFGVRGFIDHALADRTWAAALLRVWGTSMTLPRTTGARLLADLRAAQRRRRLRIPDEGAALDLVQGTVIASIRSVIEARAARDRGPEVAALLLRAFGLSAREADALARAEMPELVPEPRAD